MVSKYSNAIERIRLIPIGKDKTIPLDMILEALSIEVGSTLGSFSINPELAQHFAEFTENSAWLNLRAEPTNITRTGESTWDFKVGEYTRTFEDLELQEYLRDLLSDNSSR